MVVNKTFAELAQKPIVNKKKVKFSEEEKTEPQNEEKSTS